MCAGRVAIPIVGPTNAIQNGNLVDISGKKPAYRASLSKMIKPGGFVSHPHNSNFSAIRFNSSFRSAQIDSIEIPSIPHTHTYK